MAIRFPEPPADVARSMGEASEPAWRRAIRRGPLELGGTRDQAAEAAAPVPAQPVFTAALDQILRAGQAEDTVAGPPSWRYSRFDAGGSGQVLELIPGRAAAPAVAAGDDRFSPMIREGLALAQGDPRVRDRDYEARLFRVPALRLLALWLHADGTPDLFVALGGGVPGVAPARVYDHDEFLAAVRGAAETAAAAYDEAERPDELGS